MAEPFEPIIVAFCCQWCSYNAADLAGAMRLEYPPNVRIVRVPCTGRVDALHLLGTLERGIDGVFISGCLPGECHYARGNLRAMKRVRYVQSLLEQIGVEPERVEMFHNAASMGPQFAQTCRDFTARIKGLGPGPRPLAESPQQVPPNTSGSRQPRTVESSDLLGAGPANPSPEWEHAECQIRATATAAGGGFSADVQPNGHHPRNS